MDWGSAEAGEDLVADLYTFVVQEDPVVAVHDDAVAAEG
jgi:hypothetical protein